MTNEDPMSEPFQRKPLSNFFIKRSLQLRLIAKIVVAAIISTIVCVATLLATYFVIYQSVSYYGVTLDTKTHFSTISEPKNIIFLILPSLAVSVALNILVAFFIGLYASRKYAVPIYKLEQWARMIRQGKIAAQIRFREREEMKELSDDCNELTSDLRTKFCEIKKQTTALRQKLGDAAEVRNLETVLATLELEGETIEIHTTMIERPPKHS
jgi:methyl-accepting chemotaxis protein